MRTPTLMVQGTTSGAGKSTLVTALCRVLYRRGFQVAPFKPQNMALNSAVTVEGGEIGRAQAVQARASGLAPHTDMNPVLLKPQSDVGAQIIVHGRAIGEMDARRYHAYKPHAMQSVLASYERLASRYEVIVVEGAGSPAEVNLRDGDIANMGFAEAVDCPVLLVADIDRGGVFAHLVGTLAVLAPSEQARIRGLVINRFRGDPGLLEPGLTWLMEHTGKPVLGVLPWLPGLDLESEDSVIMPPAKNGTRLKIVAPVYPRIGNHTDFDILGLHPDVDLCLVGPGRAIPAADLIVLPGSKCVRADLTWLRAEGWEPVIRRHLRYGGKLIGLCGGFQMLGRSIHDPHGIEGPAGTSRGLGLFEMDTTLLPEKRVCEARGRLVIEDVEVRGYEIHAGITTGQALAHPACRLYRSNLGSGPDGACSEDGQILGTYLHGLFDTPEAGSALLRWAGLEAPAPFDIEARREDRIEHLADAVESALDVDAIVGLLGHPGSR